MSDGQMGVVSSDPNDTNSQGTHFEAARVATTRFNENDLPEAAGAPQCSCCKCQVRVLRFMAMM
eukprot:12880403-Prorocentrum_lima.AAC.1